MMFPLSLAPCWCLSSAVRSHKLNPVQSYQRVWSEVIQPRLCATLDTPSVTWLSTSYNLIKKANKLNVNIVIAGFVFVLWPLDFRYPTEHPRGYSEHFKTQFKMLCGHRGLLVSRWRLVYDQLQIFRSKTNCVHFMNFNSERVTQLYIIFAQSCTV